MEIVEHLQKNRLIHLLAKKIASERFDRTQAFVRLLLTEASMLTSLPRPVLSYNTIKYLKRH